jgi:hypothetical protein
MLPYICGLSYDSRTVDNVRSLHYLPDYTDLRMNLTVELALNVSSMGSTAVWRGEDLRGEGKISGVRRRSQG